MKKIFLLFIVLLAIVVVIPSCKKNEVEVQYETTDTDFMTQVYSNNKLKIMASQLALTKGNDIVKTYAQQSLNAHIAFQTELTTLATSKNISFTSSLLNHHQSNYSLLDQFSPSVFDKKFAELMFVSQDEAIASFIEAGQSAKVVDADVKLFITDKMSVLEMYRSQAEALVAQLESPNPQ